MICVQRVSDLVPSAAKLSSCLKFLGNQLNSSSHAITVCPKSALSKAMSSISVFHPFRPRMVFVISSRKACVLTWLPCHRFDRDAFVKYFSPSTTDTKRGATFSIIEGNGFVVKLLRHPSPSASSLYAS